MVLRFAPPGCRSPTLLLARSPGMPSSGAPEAICQARVQMYRRFRQPLRLSRSRSIASRYRRTVCRRTHKIGAVDRLVRIVKAAPQLLWICASVTGAARLISLTTLLVGLLAHCPSGRALARPGRRSAACCCAGVRSPITVDALAGVVVDPEIPGSFGSSEPDHSFCVLRSQFSVALRVQRLAASFA